MQPRRRTKGPAAAVLIPAAYPPPLSGVDMSMVEAVGDVQRLLGYSFRDPKLLQEALTHSSYPDRPSYQRLEHLGDAALNLAFTNYFFITNPGVGPGDLTAVRAANISTEKFARIAVQHRLYRFIRRNSPALDRDVDVFTDAVVEEMDEESGALPYGGSTIKAPKVLADIVESIAGAVYVDCNFDLEMLWKVIRGLLEPIVTLSTLDEQPVTALCEFCQKNGKEIRFKYRKRGNLNITNVFVDEELVGVGSSEKKLISKLNAARDARLKLSGSEPTEMSIDHPFNEVEEKEGAKHKLGIHCAKKHWQKPIYRLESEEGPAHGKRFICSVQVETSSLVLYATSQLLPRVKDAENSAASKMLSQVLNQDGD